VFSDLCDGCADCIPACPTKIIRKGRGGLPLIDFAVDGCTYCGECASVCKTGAIDRGLAEVPWTQVAVVDATCVEKQGVACRACQTRCAVSAIKFRPALGGCNDITIDTDKCGGCGACVGICPVHALAVIPPQSNVEKPRRAT